MEIIDGHNYVCKVVAKIVKTLFDDIGIYSQRKHEWSNFGLERHPGVFLRLRDKFQDCISITFINFRS